MLFVSLTLCNIDEVQAEIDFIKLTSPHFSPIDGYLPLHWAVNQDYPNIDVIAALIAANASASAKACNKGSLPLHWCVNR